MEVMLELGCEVVAVVDMRVIGLLNLLETLTDYCFCCCLLFMPALLPLLLKVVLAAVDLVVPKRPPP